MSVAFYRWLSLFSVPFSPGETTSVDCRGWHASARSDSSLQLWSSPVRTEALVYRAIADVQRMARPLLADDKHVHSKNNAWEIQKDMVPGRLHETYKKLRMLGSLSSRRPLRTVKLENGEFTTTEAQRHASGTLLQSSCKQIACDPASLTSFLKVCHASVRCQRPRGHCSSPCSYSDEIVTVSQRVRSRYATR